jgi:dihydroorotate dehydrogenase electron transfer subunit
VRAQIAFNRPISAAYRHLGILTPGFPQAFAPGQFVMVRPSLAVDPFLPRAFSIYRIEPSADRRAPVVEILYKVLGKGTQCLSRQEPGQEIELLGPLGNSFTVHRDADVAVLVAGGIGVPPIAALARHIRNPQSAIRSCVVFLGGKTSEDILCVKDFQGAGATVHITTEDGSCGTRGLITDLLAPFLGSVGDRANWRLGNQEGSSRRVAESPSRLCIFTCGPPGMLAAVARLAENFGVACQTSVEANMACGFGACMGCAIEARSNGSGPTYKLVCKDGPVFDSRVIDWEGGSPSPRLCGCHRPEVEGKTP